MALRQAVLAAVALLMAVGCSQPSRVSDPPIAERGTPSVRDLAAVGATNKALALRKLHQVVSLLPRLPGSHPVTTPPSPLLDEAPSSPDSQNALDLARWWTAPGSPRRAMSFLRAHPPRGFTNDGFGRLSSPDGLVDTLSFVGPTGRAYADLELSFAVTRLRQGVAVRADAQAIWLPKRSAAETVVPHNVVSVAIVAVRPGAPPSPRQLVIGKKAHDLALALDRLPVATAGVHSCPMSRGAADRLVFHLRRGPDVMAKAHRDGCRMVSVVVDGQVQPALCCISGTTSGKLRTLDIMSDKTNYKQRG